MNALYDALLGLALDQDVGQLGILIRREAKQRVIKCVHGVLPCLYVRHTARSIFKFCSTDAQSA